MRRRSEGYLLAPCLLIVGSLAVMAQQARLELTDPKAFRESYVSAPTGLRGGRSVEVLVGLRVGNASGRFDAQQIRLGFEGTLPSSLCVRVMARDGRYSSAATYRTSVPMRTPGIEAPTRYAQELGGYGASDLAINAFIAPACEAARATEFFVAMQGKADEAGILFVQVNAPSSRVRAQPRTG